MIKVDEENKTYVCPFCGCRQAYTNSYSSNYITYQNMRNSNYSYSAISIYHCKCTKKDCNRITVFAINDDSTKQWDLIPEMVYNHYPDYIPQQIRNDYEEASIIIDRSPKAAATLLRRCLQGMIHDFWNIRQKNLNAEITALKDKISATQWAAIDGLRSIGNIGAHMEYDVNLLIEIDSSEATELQRLIELLINKWYITKHDEEELFKSITSMSQDKDAKRSIKT